MSMDSNLYNIYLKALKFALFPKPYKNACFIMRNSLLDRSQAISKILILKLKLLMIIKSIKKVKMSQLDL